MLLLLAIAHRFLVLLCYCIQPDCSRLYTVVSQSMFTTHSCVHCHCRVLRAGEWRQKDVAWPFKIVYILDTDAKVHYFSAASEDEMKVVIIF